MVFKRLTALVTVLFTIAYGVAGPQILRLLTDDAHVVAAAERYLPWVLLIPAVGMAAFVWDGIFIGITATRGMLVSSFVATVAFFALWLLFAPAMGNNALWLALSAYLLLRGVVQTWLFVKKFVPLHPPSRMSGD